MISIHYWTKDVSRIIEHYTQVLGFKLDYRQPAEGDPDFCILSRSGATLMFGLPMKDVNRTDREVTRRSRERAGSPGPMSVYIEAMDIGAYYEQCTANGAQIIEPLWDTPWRTRQFTVVDPDENMTTFHVEQA